MSTTFTSVAQIPTGTWELDPSSTTLTVTATKAGVFKVPATLDVVSASITSDGGEQGPQISVVADAASYTSKNGKRNEHIRSADFLDAEHHPHIRFYAQGATATAEGFQVQGTATVKEQQSPLTLEVTKVVVDGDQVTFAASATMDRFALGLGALPAAFIAKDVRLDVTATAHRR